MVKYNTSPDEGNVLPNLLGITDEQLLHQSELEGFLYAAMYLSERLSPDTRFDARYICNIHRLALSHLYKFAGKYRSVNMSKGGFVFPSAIYIDQAMTELERDFLNKLSQTYSDTDTLIRDVASVHAELLFIHPFREGNGRTARLLANLMVQKQGYPPLHFEYITDTHFTEYVCAVQSAADRNYRPMEEIIRKIFSVNTTPITPDK